MMRVLIIEHGLGFGGSFMSLKRVLQYVDRSQFEPILLLDSTTASAELINDLGIRVIKLPQPFNQQLRNTQFRPPLSYAVHLGELLVSVLPQAIRLARLIKRERIALVHLNNHIDSQYAGILAARLAGVPCVVHLRNMRPLRKTERLFGSLVTRFISLSNLSLDHYAAEGLPKDRMSVVCDPVAKHGTTPLQRSEVRQQLGIPSGVPVVGMFSRLAQGKGHEYFFEAASMISRQHSDAHFVIVGKEEHEPGTVSDQLRRQVESLGLASRTHFLGWRTDVQDVMNACDIVVDTSCLFEGPRLTILEAMALGKPVIATRIGEVTEWIEHDHTGLLVTPASAEALASALRNLLEDLQRAQRLGEAGRARILDVCDPQRSAEKLQQVYETVLRTNGHSNGDGRN